MKGIIHASTLIAAFIAKYGISAPLDNRCPPHYVYQPGAGAPSQQVPDGELKCGKWKFDGIQLAIVNATSKENCHKQCTGECDVSKYYPSYDSDNCKHFSSKTTDGEYNAFMVDNALCSKTFVGTEVPLVEGGCEPKAAVGIILQEFQTSASSVAECNEICKTKPECTHSMFSINFATSQGRCNLFKEDEDGDDLTFWPGESFCYVKKATELPNNPPGELKCGQWQFYGRHLGNTTAISEKDCYSKCTGDCDVTRFNPFLESENCDRFTSRARDANVVTAFYANNTICSDRYVGIEPSRVEGGCPQIRINGTVINAGFEPRTRTAADCMAWCVKEAECSHASFYHVAGDPIGYCGFFKEDPEEEEYGYYAHQSLCPRPPRSTA